MTTNVLLLPKFSGQGTVFAITQDADWNDSIFFAVPGSLGQPLQIIGRIVNGSNVVEMNSVDGLSPGMQIVEMNGVPSGAFIGAIASGPYITMVDIHGAPLVADASDYNATITFQPAALDLTGIEFKAQLRSVIGGNESFLTITTADGSFNNGGTTGVLGFNIPKEQVKKIFPGTYVIDIIAIADGVTINMFPEGPASVIVSIGVTDPTP